MTSGAPDTRLWRRPVLTPLPTPGLPAVLAAKAGAWLNIAPPGSSKWPVTMFSASISQLLSVPYSWVQVPMRP